MAITLPRHLDDPFAGHGAFIYQAGATIAKFGSAQGVADAMKAAGMSHAWVRIHGRTKIHSRVPTQSLIDTLRDNEINVAGWGWCQGADISFEADLALRALKRFDLEYYVPDIEHKHNNSYWTRSEVRRFLDTLRQSGKIKQMVVSTFGFIKWHEPCQPSGRKST